MIIYRITNLITGLKYIGQTSTTLQRRWLYHRRPDASFCRLLHEALKIYGHKKFKIETICSAKNQDELDSLEEKYIREENTRAPGGYNLLAGGKNRKHHPLTCQKMSQSRMGVPNFKLRTPRGPMSETRKLNISRAKKGRPNGLLGKKKAFVRKPKRFRPIVAIDIETGAETIYAGIVLAAEGLNLQHANIHAVLRGSRNHTGHHTFYRLENPL